MPLPACLVRGHKYQPGLSTFAVFLKQNSVNQRACRQNGSGALYSQRWAHIGIPTPHHEAAIENIRNIGIIAHVDAVRV